MEHTRYFIAAGSRQEFIRYIRDHNIPQSQSRYVTREQDLAGVWGIEGNEVLLGDGFYRGESDFVSFLRYLLDNGHAKWIRIGA